MGDILRFGVILNTHPTERMLPRLVILLGLSLGGTLGAAVNNNGEEANREGRLWWPVKYVIDYRNTSCTTDSGYDGYCFMAFECAKGGGLADGECGPDGEEAYGVCCDYTAGGTTTIGGSGGYFSNKGYPKGDSKTGLTIATLDPPAGTCQVKLTFEEFDLLGPSDGDCNNDTFIFSGANSEVEVPVLCGYNTGQHMYINVDSSEGPWKIIQSSSDDDYDRKFSVKVDYLGLHDANKAPPRCLQSYPDAEGEMMSFNYNPNEDSSQMLNNQNYVICFGYNPGKCDVGINAARFDLGNLNGNCDDDFASLGCNKYCGDFRDLQLQSNSTGTPVQYIWVSSDDDNSNQEEGFMASYMMMPCE